MEKSMIKIFDTTLRDGGQTPGVSLETREKLEIAQALARLKVDVIEAGFPIASLGDFDAVSQIAARIKGPVIAGLARASTNDIDAAHEALKKAERPRIHTFLATSDIYMQYKLKLSREQVLLRAKEAVRYARQFVPEVEFSAEDATRSDWDFLCKVFTAVIAAGATVINVPDTVGFTTPEEFGKLIHYIHENVPNIAKAEISVHCHNDLGMAVADSLAAVQNGALQVHATINGLGERAGNTALEELVMALHARKAFYQAVPTVDTRHIYRTSRLVSTLTGVLIPPGKAIVGDNAFVDEAGLHQHGGQNNALTYDIISPESVGISRNLIALGKHSGRQAFEERLKELGYDLEADSIDRLFIRFKELADRKKAVFDRDIEALINEKADPQAECYALTYHQVVSGNKTVAMATVKLETSAGEVQQAFCGDGPVDAVFKAIEAAVGFEISLKDYAIRAVTSGQDALGEAVVWVERDGRSFSGRGLSTDVIEASAKAYVNAINKMLSVCGMPDKAE